MDDKWQPIETAPKNETVLTWDGFEVCAAVYRVFPEFEEWLAAVGSQGSRDDDFLDYQDACAEEPDGWISHEAASGDQISLEPISWQPLPQPPQGTGT